MVSERSRDEIWTYIVNSKYKINPSLDDKKFLKSLRSLLNAFYQDYSFVKNKTDTKPVLNDPYSLNPPCENSSTHPYKASLLSNSSIDGNTSFKSLCVQ